MVRGARGHDMVTILEFRRQGASDPAPEADTKPDELPKGHSAEIIIFPGVRIERQPGNSSDDLEEDPARKARGPASSE